jgi:hypothetical protein
MTAVAYAPPVLSPDPDCDPASVPACCLVTARMTGGLHEALRVAMMLRGRHYQVRELNVEVHDEGAGSCLRAAVLLTAREAALLRERLLRIPVVVSAELA